MTRTPANAMPGGQRKAAPMATGGGVMRSTKRALAVSGFFIAVSLVAGTAWAINPHFVGSSSCTQSGDTLSCSFKVAGLGSAPASIGLSVPFVCQNRGLNYPGGLASTRTRPITPDSGQVTITDLTVTAHCPDQMREIFTGPVTVTVTSKGTTYTVGTIPIT